MAAIGFLPTEQLTEQRHKKNKCVGPPTDLHPRRHPSAGREVARGRPGGGPLRGEGSATRRRRLLGRRQGLRQLKIDQFFLAHGHFLRPKARPQNLFLGLCVTT